ncbi:MAG: hypothetical protein HY717_12035 [Planctomycetes bacterium]|nr:hypothetical protein [Planctomycetota bacterium]
MNKRAFYTTVLWLFPCLHLPGEDKPEKPPFETLLRLNADKLFGGKVVELSGDRFKVAFQNPEEFARGFSSDNLIRPKDLHGNQTALIDKVDHVIGAGDKNGAWTSRFMVGQEFRINFIIKVPILLRGSQLNVQISSEKGALITQFFNKAALIRNGKPVKQEVTPHKEFSGSPEKWFDRKAEKVPVEISFAKKKLNVKLKFKDKDTDMVSLEDDKTISGGKVEIQFRNLTFAIGDLQISSKLNRPWCEEQLKALEASGKLKVKEDAPPQEQVAAQEKKDPAKEKEELRQKEAADEL